MCTAAVIIPRSVHSLVLVIYNEILSVAKQYIYIPTYSHGETLKYRCQRRKKIVNKKNNKYMRNN